MSRSTSAAAALLACLSALAGPAALAAIDDPRPVPRPPEPAPPAAPVGGLPDDAANSLTVAARLAYRLADGSSPRLGPTSGFSLGARFERRYHSLPAGLSTGAWELGVALDLFFDRFSLGLVEGILLEGMAQADPQRVITQTSFVLMQTAALRLSGVRPWVGLGAGLSVGYLTTPEQELAPGNATAVQPVARAAAGVEATVRGRLAIAVIADYSQPLTRPSFTTQAGTRYGPFGPLFDAGLALVYRF